MSLYRLLKLLAPLVAVLALLPLKAQAVVAPPTATLVFKEARYEVVKNARAEGAVPDKPVVLNARAGSVPLKYDVERPNGSATLDGSVRFEVPATLTLRLKDGVGYVGAVPVKLGARAKWTGKGPAAAKSFGIRIGNVQSDVQGGPDFSGSTMVEWAESLPASTVVRVPAVTVYGEQTHTVRFLFVYERKTSAAPKPLAPLSRPTGPTASTLPVWPERPTVPGSRALPAKPRLPALPPVPREIREVPVLPPVPREIRGTPALPSAPRGSKSPFPGKAAPLPAGLNLDR